MTCIRTNETHRDHNAPIEVMKLCSSDFPYEAKDECFRILYVKEGTVKLNLNKIEYRSSKGTIVFVNSHSKYAIEESEGHGKVLLILIQRRFFTPRIRERLSYYPMFYDFLSYCAKEGQQASSHQMFQSDDESLPLILHLFSLLQEYKDSHCAEEFFLSLISYLSSQTTRYVLYRDRDNPHQSEINNDIIKIVNYIYKNYRDVSLVNLAEEFHYSPNYLSNLIRQSTHLTFCQHVTQKRLEVARHLLQEDKKPIKHIIKYVGYDDKSSFYRQFKKYFGVTPSQMREQTQMPLKRVNDL